MGEVKFNMNVLRPTGFDDKTYLEEFNDFSDYDIQSGALIIRYKNNSKQIIADGHWIEASLSVVTEEQ